MITHVVVSPDLKVKTAKPTLTSVLISHARMMLTVRMERMITHVVVSTDLKVKTAKTVRVRDGLL
jgi:hypothetical protein